MEPQQLQQQPKAISQANPADRSLGAWPGTFLILAFLGFLDATYLTIEHYLGLIPPCTIAHGCQTVTTSIYSTVAGIPIALFGALYYFTLFILAIFYFDQKRKGPRAGRRFLKTASYLTTAGFLVSLCLVFLQLFVIHAICPYCMFSATMCLFLFITGMYLIRLMRNPQQ